MLLALHSQLNKYGLCLNSWAFLSNTLERFSGWILAKLAEI